MAAARHGWHQCPRCRWVAPFARFRNARCWWVAPNTSESVGGNKCPVPVGGTESPDSGGRSRWVAPFPRRASAGFMDNLWTRGTQSVTLQNGDCLKTRYSRCQLLTNELLLPALPQHRLVSPTLRVEFTHSRPSVFRRERGDIPPRTLCGADLPAFASMGSIFALKGIPPGITSPWDPAEWVSISRASADPTLFQILIHACSFDSRLPRVARNP